MSSSRNADGLPKGFWTTGWRLTIVVIASFPLTAGFLLDATRARGAPLWPSSAGVVLSSSAIFLIFAGYWIRKRAIASGPEDRAQAVPWKWVIIPFVMVVLLAMGLGWLTLALRG